MDQTFSYDGILYRPSGSYPVKSSGIVLVTAGQGIPASLGGAGNDPNRISRAIPSGAKILVQGCSLTVLNGPPSDILLSIGCTMPFSNWIMAPGSLFSGLGEIPINEIGDAPGPIFVDLFNIDGTTLTGATNVGVTIQVTVALNCVLLLPANNGSNVHS